MSSCKPKALTSLKSQVGDQVLELWHAGGSLTEREILRRVLQNAVDRGLILWKTVLNEVQMANPKANVVQPMLPSDQQTDEGEQKSHQSFDSIATPTQLQSTLSP